MGDNAKMRRDEQKARTSHKRALLRDESGATTLEWALLLAAIGLPSYFIFQLALATLVGHYQLITTINALPFP